MATLRLTQKTSDKPSEHSVEVVLEGDGPRKRAEANFDFELTPQDWYDLRWYMEDYLQYPLDPNPEIAKRIETRMDEIGRELFVKIFGPKGTPEDPILDAFRIWDKVLPKLNETRIEIVTDIKGATNIPWELIRTSDGKKVLALAAQEFVRTHPDAIDVTSVPQTETGPIRILLVICRPREERDVPFRSVASRILKGLGAGAEKTYQLDVLRPPTFKHLGEVLTAAKNAGKPYHVVHFDGHGAYLNIKDLFEKWENDEKAMLRFLAEWLNISTNRFSPDIMYPNQVRDGKRGYLIFENPESEYNLRLVDGPELGEILQHAGVPILVLNACRSAHTDPLTKPEDEEEKQSIHSQVRTFGSFAQEVSDSGAAGVVAMRYNVYVYTAASFIADLYESLVSGLTLGEAVNHGRQDLAADSLRTIAFDPINLQDWSVPVVYEAAPIQLFPKPAGARGTGAVPAPIRIDISQAAKPADELPRPDIGFFGRDETLLALDRAFDTQSIVLLHAYAGSGKTMTAAEFARWYQQTGGMSVGATHASPLPAPILFTSFETYKPLERVLDTVEQVFRQLLEANNIQWLAMDAETRLNITLQIFKQIPVLWIWDNVEPINGFPPGTNSAWTEAEQRELKMFLQIVTAQTRAKFLLTSRRDERTWLGDLPRRVRLPPMPMQEMVQLARALAEKGGRRITDVEDWRPLLDFTKGNPLTINVIVGQALRDGITTKAKIQAYVQKLRSGETAFTDESSEGRAKSLGASLSYGFETAFSEDERKVLALLHFFQGFVETNVIRWMVEPDEKTDWGLGYQGYTNEKIAKILDTAADIGLLTPHGGGYYTIHPALPWFFRALFEQYYPESDDRPQTVDGENMVYRPSSTVALRAFVQSLGELGDYYANQYMDGNRDVIAPLRAEEANLLHARALALSGLRQSQGEYASAVISAMQGLNTLYDHTGRRAEWQRLVAEIVPDFVGPSDLPLPGRDAQWGLITEYRVLLAMEARDWPAAERLQRLHVEWDRRNAAALLARPPETLGAHEKNTLRTLAVSMEQLGQIQRDVGMAECAQTLQDAIPICQQSGDKAEEAVLAFNLGRAYTELPALRDLEAAERWYQRSLELRAEGDRLGRSKSIKQIGQVFHERFRDARSAKLPESELLKYFNGTVNHYQDALALLTPDAVNDLAPLHNNLGSIYDDVGDLERALYHYNQAINYKERAGDIYSAGTTRFNVAIALANNGRLADALLYARAALRNFEPYGQGAAEDIEDAKRVIGKIERLIEESKK